MPLRITRNLALIAGILALVVVILGAYTRLSNAGLGCPDWPGCFGQISVPTQTEHIQAAARIFPHLTVEPHKAWAEMTHRYFAAALGILILLLTFHAWKQRHEYPNYPVKLPSILLLLVIFQALLGMWTVTLKLNPLIVMSHLLVGMTTFALLLSLYALSQRRIRHFRLAISVSEGTQFQKLATWTLVVVGIQIALGGWTSANYAALVCTKLPICQGDWWAHLAPLEAFKLWGHAADNYEFGVKSLQARITIQVTHRLWAVVTLLTSLCAGWRLVGADCRILNRLGMALMVLVSTQVVLGISNIFFSLPLGVAVAHNAVGALLLATLVGLNVLLWAARTITHDRR